MHPVHDRDEGFSLVELTTVVVIIAVLLAIATVSYSLSTERAGSVACENNRRFLERVAVSEYRIENGANPSSILDLASYVSNWDAVRVCPTDPGLELYLDTDRRSVLCPKHGK